jgi:hypothetical protein
MSPFDFWLSRHRPDHPGEEDPGRLGAAIGEEPVSVLDPLCKPCLLGRVGPVELPGDPHRALDEVPAWFVGRLEISGPGFEPVLIGLFILMRQDHGCCAQAVGNGIEPDLGLARGRPWPRAFGGVSFVGVDLCLTDHGCALWES